MKRNLPQMAAQTYDLLVIGGGIYGAFVAWDAALRGLTVALVEKADFGHATSANSLKTLHGGLRYLQDGNLPLVRAMIRERKTWLRLAPHLTRPLPFILPTRSWGKQSRPALAAALALNDFIGLDRNRGLPATHHLPPSRTLSRRQCLAHLPGLAHTDLTGGALWHDAQLLDSERLLLSVLQAAVAAGAEAANYASVEGWLRQGNRVHGVLVSDRLNGRSYEIQARLTINCAGAWIDEVLGPMSDQTAAPKFPLSTAMNLITRPIAADVAVGLFGRYQGTDGQTRQRVLFAAPWQGYSIIGTLHLPFDKTLPDGRVDEATVQAFIQEINAAYPAADLSRSDVRHVQIGLLPASGVTDHGDVRLLRRGRIHDHGREDGIAGVITVVGVKYTTARLVAEQAVNLGLEKLGEAQRPCLTKTTTLANQGDAAPQTALPLPVRAHLQSRFGEGSPLALACLQENPASDKPVTTHPLVLEVEIIHAVRNEMAFTLSDVVRRRTPLGAAGLPAEAILQTCANLMAAELGWTTERKQQEITAVKAAYATTDSPISSETTQLGWDNL